MNSNSIRYQLSLRYQSVILFANRNGIHPRTVYTVISGKRWLPGVAKKIADALGLSLAETWGELYPTKVNNE